MSKQKFPGNKRDADGDILCFFCGEPTQEPEDMGEFDPYSDDTLLSCEDCAKVLEGMF